MSIFNFRRGRPASDSASGKKRSAAAPAAESVELVRKRARQRLMGSAVLVLLGVVGFPLLFETQPRPVPVDIPIEIPSRASVKPASPVPPVERQESPAVASVSDAAPPPAPAASVPAPSPATTAPIVPPQASLHDKEEIVPHQDTKAAVRTEPKPEPKAEVKVQATPRADDGQRAKALLEGASLKPAASETRIVVQVGAFSDVAKAREARAKLEKAGLKTYTQMTDTKDGTRIRVRVGPYASKAEAEKAAAKVKSLNLPAAILIL